jgi:hypothetical protein
MVQCSKWVGICRYTTPELLFLKFIPALINVCYIHLYSSILLTVYHCFAIKNIPALLHLYFQHCMYLSVFLGVQKTRRPSSKSHVQLIPWVGYEMAVFVRLSTNFMLFENAGSEPRSRRRIFRSNRSLKVSDDSVLFGVGLYFLNLSIAPIIKYKMKTFREVQSFRYQEKTDKKIKPICWVLR